MNPQRLKKPRKKKQVKNLFTLCFNKSYVLFNLYRPRYFSGISFSFSETTHDVLCKFMSEKMADSDKELSHYINNCECLSKFVNVITENSEQQCEKYITAVIAFFKKNEGEFFTENELRAKERVGQVGIRDPKVRFQLLVNGTFLAGVLT